MSDGVYEVTSVIERKLIDFEGHYEDELIQEVMAEIDSDALEVRLLGSYPRAINYR